MTFRLPGPLPQGFDPHGPNRNPGQTMPMPRPDNVPAGGWNAQEFTISAASYVGPGDGIGFRAATWRSPIFDLQPQLRNLMPQSGVGAGGNAQAAFNSSPIWSLAPGTGSRDGCLRVMISNLRGAANSMTNMEFFASEFGHPNTSGLMQQVLPSTSITTHVNNNLNAVLLSFHPIGQRSPLRFWQLQIRAVKTINDGLALPIYNFSCGYY